MRDGESVSKEDRDIGERLAVARHAAGLSQRTAAAALGFAQSRIGKLETGSRRLLFSEAVALARLYQVPLEAFATGSAPDGGSKRR